ncbi:MAG: rhodanese-like domain-containing protein [bacterium]
MNDLMPFLIPIGLIVVALVARSVMMGRFISSEEAHRRVEAGAILLDVRSRAEFEAGHIKGAINIPVDEVGRRSGELKQDAEIVLYCGSGARSAQARSILTAKGFKSLFNLGPMSAW